VSNPTSLDEVILRTRPVMLARDQVVPVLDGLRGLMPEGGLQRGSTVVIDGVDAVCSLALALATGPSIDGGWVAVVGHNDLGLAAAIEMGLVPERLALIREPPAPQWATVVAALIGAVDVVVIGSAVRLRGADAARLAARVRERGTVLIQADPTVRAARVTGRPSTLETDVRLSVISSRWQGLGVGHGHLCARRITVEATGRRRASRLRRAELWLPDVHGHVCSPVTQTDLIPVRYAGADIDQMVESYSEVG